MTDAMIFVGLMVAVVLAYIAWRLRGRSWREYFSTRDDRQYDAVGVELEWKV
ncbi:MAG: hypothetical protein GY701_25265 [Sulfitobacter sp.]|uniref:hypothetical protein n=1 Tax=Sphingomonas sp. TaxID=28214 RepID=UPI00258E4044|nr:hypothetical protein [Sphingomonas sp.]MCP3881670.1 hypothetical protein [Sulfitobacter sp.]MCP4029329.1 hypothetical protein [Sphingomonas sp.]